jgi:hypothetical protein
MALVVTATPSPYGGLYMEMSVSGGTAPYTWRAFPTGTDPYTVPATVTNPSGNLTVDGYAPFGRDILYRATDSTGAVGEAVAALTDPPGGVLSDALDPNRAVVLPVLDQLPNQWEARSVWFDVLDRRDPFVAVAPLRFRNGELVVRVDGNDQRQSVIDLLAPGNPLVFRSPCVSALDDVVMLPTSVREALVVEADKSGPRTVTITYQAVTRELGPYLPDPTWTWELVGLDSRLPSWTAFVDTFATWSDAVANVRKP